MLIAWKHRLGHPTEPRLLFPILAFFILAMIWMATLNLIDTERSAAENAAVMATRELAETYQAQVVRAVREIDQTLKLIQYAYELRGGRAALEELKAWTLLPPEMLFVVSITDSKGDIVASTSSAPSGVTNVADQDYFRSQRYLDNFTVGHSVRDPVSGEWWLQFSRRLSGPNAEFDGVVIIAVKATYFTSGYESSKLGEHGVLGILGVDGVFRVKRSGDAVAVGDSVDYSAFVPPIDQPEMGTLLSTNSWDGVRRYTIARRLYFPLAVVVGLSADEQLAAAYRDRRVYLWRASAASLLVILLFFVLGRMSHQLALSRERIVEEKLARAAQVEYMAYHDILTGLPNRSFFSKLLAQSIREARRHDRQLAVLFLDLDRFKHINDTLGHDAGDQLLQEVAKRLKGCLRESDTVARLGGDEFIVLLPQLEVEKYTTTVAQKILTSLARPFTLNGEEFRITCSIGISAFPHDGADEQTLTKNADIALYKAKEEGKNNFQFYSEKLSATSLERLTLESGLRRALERNEFRLHYQPKREIQSGSVTGMEALLRWQHPDLGVVTPLQFIPLAEETGLIVPIGKWVIRTACLQSIAWQKQGLPPLRMAVNLTARQFYDRNLLSDLKVILAETGMDPSLLELEINEALLMRDVEKTLHIMTALKSIGIRFAIDDFGIGYSSLSMLKQFPLDTIKIDRSFIRSVQNESEEKDVTKAIIMMGKTLSLTVVAQGVETAEQADFLRQNACDELQGFYFNKPVPGEQVADLLKKETATPGDNRGATPA
jgi:diguanylate cyclase (GGDEF)-like protein